MATFCVHGIVLSDFCSLCAGGLSARVPHDPNNWTRDRREIVAAQLSAHPAYEVLLAIDGWSFGRFERNGEMAAIPYLRATKDDATIEAPLREWDFVEFSKDPVE